MFRIGKCLQIESKLVLPKAEEVGVESEHYEDGMLIQLLWRGDENIAKHILAMIIQIYEYTENNWIVYFILTYFVACELNHNSINMLKSKNQT